MEYRLSDFLPTTKKEVEMRGPLALPSLDVPLSPQAIEWLLFRNQTGMVTTETLRNWADRACSLEWLRGVWTLW